MRQKGVLLLLALMGLLATGAFLLAGAKENDPREKKDAPEPEPEIIIVKYGTVTVKSPVTDTRVYIDEVYKGVADITIENVVTGEHVVSCKQGERTISGTFTVKKNETLKLEARFDAGKIVNITEPEKAEAEKKKKPEPKAAEEKKREQKSPAEERRELHLNVIKVEFRDSGAQEVAVGYKANPKIISNYAEGKGQTGKYYRTKQGLLLCDAGPCVQEWTAKFFYTDETGKRDAFLFTWKQTVFSGITPSGTSSRELTWCLNGTCTKLGDSDTSNIVHTAVLDRYTLSWSKPAAFIRRSDIVKEILDAGGSLPEQ